MLGQGVYQAAAVFVVEMILAPDADVAGERRRWVFEGVEVGWRFGGTLEVEELAAGAEGEEAGL